MSEPTTEPARSASPTRPTCSRSPVSSLPPALLVRARRRCQPQGVWAAFGLGIALAVTDFFDGRVARRSNVVSRSGAFLDPLADKIVVIGGAYCLVYVERYWWVPVTIIACEARHHGLSQPLGQTGWRCRPNLGRTRPSCRRSHSSWR